MQRPSPAAAASVILAADYDEAALKRAEEARYAKAHGQTAGSNAGWGPGGHPTKGRAARKAAKTGRQRAAHMGRRNGKSW